MKYIFIVLLLAGSANCFSQVNGLKVSHYDPNRYFLIGYMAQTKDNKAWSGGIDTVMFTYPNRIQICRYIHDKFPGWGLWDIKILAITEMRKEDYGAFWKHEN